MSDTSQGPGWWQASDGKWYPPEQAPGYQAAPSGYGAAPAGGGGSVDIGNAFNYGWAKFQANVGQLIVALAVGFVLMLVLAGIGYFVLLVTALGGSTCSYNAAGFYSCSSPNFIVMLIGYGVFFALYFTGMSLFQMALIRVGLFATKGQPMDTSDLFGMSTIGPYIVMSILVGLATGIGYMLCFIPGIIVAFLCYFSGFFLLDKGLSPVDAIKASINMVKDNIGSVILFILAAFVANAIGAALCGIGLVVSVPVVSIAGAYVYRQLQGEPIAP